MKTDIPTYERIVALHKKYAPSEAAFELVFTHCQIVWQLAKLILAHSSIVVDRDLVKAGCLLHDIGVYELYLPSGHIDHANYIKHGALGYAVLRREGYSEKLCRMAAHHTGVGLTKKDVIEGNLPIPAKDYLAETIEEKLVMYADKFHTKTNPPKFMQAATYRQKVSQFGEDKADTFDQLTREFGVPDVAALAAKYGVHII